MPYVTPRYVTRETQGATLVISNTTAPETGAGVLYAVSARWTEVGVFMREDEILAGVVRSTGWMKCVSVNAYDNVWRRRFQQVGGDPYLPGDREWFRQNLLETWLMPFSQLSDHEGYTGDTL